MALFRGIQEYIALDANNITLVFDSGNIVNISGNIFLYPPLGHPILYNYLALHLARVSTELQFSIYCKSIYNFNSTSSQKDDLVSKASQPWFGFLAY